MRRALACLAIALLTQGATAASAVRPLIPHEGRLLRADGAAESGGTTLVFRLYESATLGTAVWIESHAVTPSASGYYSVLLGSINPALPPFDGRDYWLGITVSGEAEMAPRTRLGAVPYALRANSAAQVDSVSDSTADLAAGACMTIAHNLGTYGVFYQAWMSDGTLPSSELVPMNLGSTGVAGQNLAASGTCGASSTAGGSYLCSAATDGIKGTYGWSPNTTTGYWTVNFGAVKTIDRVRIYAYNTLGYFFQWQIAVGNDGVSWSAPIASGACTVGGTCSTDVETTFAPVQAQYVKITGGAASNASYGGFGEIEIYGAQFPLKLLDQNTIQLCNYTGAQRRFTLVVGR